MSILIGWKWEDARRRMPGRTQVCPPFRPSPVRAGCVILAMMGHRVFLDIDPRTLRLPPSRGFGADPLKLQRQIVRFGASIQGMPALEVSRGADGELLISDGVTRATRVAQLLPGVLVRVEVIDDLPIPVGYFPAVGDFLP